MNNTPKTHPEAMYSGARRGILVSVLALASAAFSTDSSAQPAQRTQAELLAVCPKGPTKETCKDPRCADTEARIARDKACDAMKGGGGGKGKDDKGKEDKGTTVVEPPLDCNPNQEGVQGELNGCDLANIARSMESSLKELSALRVYACAEPKTKEVTNPATKEKVREVVKGSIQIVEKTHEWVRLHPQEAEAEGCVERLKSQDNPAFQNAVLTHLKNVEAATFAINDAVSKERYDGLQTLLLALIAAMTALSIIIRTTQAWGTRKNINKLTGVVGGANDPNGSFTPGVFQGVQDLNTKLVQLYTYPIPVTIPQAPTSAGGTAPHGAGRSTP